MKHILNVLKWVVVLALVLGLAFLVYVGVKITEPQKTVAAAQAFVVGPGSTTREIAAKLESEALISRAFFFELYVYFKKSGHKVQAGTYTLSPSMSIVEIVGKLTTGEVVQNEVKLTVIEGWTMSEIAEALEASGLVRARDFLKLTPTPFSEEFEFLQEVPRGYFLLEGYLFPDTYILEREATPEEIARKMIANFDKKLTADLRQKITDQSKTIRQIVILASIIEQEVGRSVKRGTKLGESELEKLEQERRLVSSVFWNRLELGKSLESDATISYITGRQGSSRATLEETKINSPYNTDRYVGLPPGPLSNPSLDSIMDAVAPADTEYLFFLTAADGTAYFARTLEEHIVNRNKYLDNQ